MAPTAFKVLKGDEGMPASGSIAKGDPTSVLKAKSELVQRATNSEPGSAETPPPLQKLKGDKSTVGSDAGSDPPSVCKAKLELLRRAANPEPGSAETPPPALKKQKKGDKGTAAGGSDAGSDPTSACKAPRGVKRALRSESMEPRSAQKLRRCKAPNPEHRSAKLRLPAEPSERDGGATGATSNSKRPSPFPDAATKKSCEAIRKIKRERSLEPQSRREKGRARKKAHDGPRKRKVKKAAKASAPTNVVIDGEEDGEGGEEEEDLVWRPSAKVKLEMEQGSGRRVKREPEEQAWPSERFIARLPMWKEQCIEHQRSGRMWHPLRPCCLPNFWTTPRCPPECKDGVQVPCLERLTQDQSRLFRQVVESGKRLPHIEPLGLVDTWDRLVNPDSEHVPQTKRRSLNLATFGGEKTAEDTSIWEAETNHFLLGADLVGVEKCLRLLDEGVRGAVVEQATGTTAKRATNRDDTELPSCADLEVEDIHIAKPGADLDMEGTTAKRATNRDDTELPSCADLEVEDIHIAKPGADLDMEGELQADLQEPPEFLTCPSDEKEQDTLGKKVTTYKASCIGTDTPVDEQSAIDASVVDQSIGAEDAESTGSMQAMPDGVDDGDCLVENRACIGGFFTDKDVEVLESDVVKYQVPKPHECRTKDKVTSYHIQWRESYGDRQSNKYFQLSSFTSQGCSHEEARRRAYEKACVFASALADAKKTLPEAQFERKSNCPQVTYRIRDDGGGEAKDDERLTNEYWEFKKFYSSTKRLREQTAIFFPKADTPECISDALIEAIKHAKTRI
eukprot:TRINITY_DN4224_c0_g1_i1.p1 TRINITY_DN4224_c0_g1~~TRINITY_DN4224_c0_g1_i1.p1  ORF type:complete len:915 (-),score=159.92 TRINITY_DN4224_c0_g1_i1:247-2622(-)